MDKPDDKKVTKDASESAPPPDPDEVLRRMLETPPKPHKPPKNKVEISTRHESKK